MALWRVILGAVFILGFFLDWIEISLIILPLLAPVVAALGFEVNGYGVIDNPELIWFRGAGCGEPADLVSDPAGGICPLLSEGVWPPEGTELMDIYKGVIPFIILQLIGLIIIALWPQLVIWLPAIAYGN